MSRVSRRKFLKSSATFGALAMAGGSSVIGKPAKRGANDTIRMAVAGIKGRGGSHIGAFSGMKGVELVYVVDPDSRLFGGRIKQAQDASKGRSNPKGAQDIRDVLDDDSIDAISIATPNHWHSLMTIWACQAGKDVYVEKPMSHNIHEGRIAVETARKYKRIVQHGTQSRSSGGWAKVVNAIASGKLGKLLVSRGLCYKAGGGGSSRGSIGFRPHKQPPSELDFGLWLGPAVDQPYHENLVHYRWHWFWDFGNGDTGNQGVHQMDIARWAIPGATLPKSVLSIGGRLGYYDQGETCSTQVVTYDFGETQLIFETRGLPSKKYRGQGTGNIFELEAGTILGQKFFPNDSDKEAPLPEVDSARGPGGGIFGNFIAAVRSRKESDLDAPVLEAHHSSALCHLGNMSHRLGTKVPLTPRTQAFDDNERALDAVARMEEYLAGNGVDLATSGCTLGRKLVVDAETETIVGDAQANAALTRNYRAPFLVPDKV